MSHSVAAMPMSARADGPLSGRVRVPGDKSISHRAVIFGALAIGRTEITGLLDAEDVQATARAVQAMGAMLEIVDGRHILTGCGVGGLVEPAEQLDFGNSGTGARLMMGVIAGHPMTARFMGDPSLSRRPMGRVLAPLCSMGLEVPDADGEHLPLTLRGTEDLIPISYAPPIPSAQVKSAVLLAGLHAAGRTTVTERAPTRDHTERMLRAFGADVTISDTPDGRAISVGGHAELVGRRIDVPGDPSSAAFVCAAVLATPGSHVVIEHVLMNPTRTGFFDTVREMGGRLDVENEGDSGGEPVADIVVRAAPLTGVVVPPERAPSMIDEYPVLAALAAFATGTTVMRGLAELRVKESDRLAATQAALHCLGVEAVIDGDDLVVHGRGRMPGGGPVATHMDHRIAMAFLSLGLAADRPVTVDDGSMIATSFPDFAPLMRQLGGSVHAQGQNVT